uniref:HEPN domain-containing protein n=1 Tax=viral metagenome TaxID=1070528 RepID=A0A6H1ZR39_9ZZZZ
MTIDEAIEVLHEDLGAALYDEHPYFYQAQKLGIEALKRCRTLAQESKLWALHPLPGETKE